jgi:hypothetical protein
MIIDLKNSALSNRAGVEYINSKDDPRNDASRI